MENKKENKKIENNEEINSEWFENNGYKLPEDLIDYDSDLDDDHDDVFGNDDL